MTSGSQNPLYDKKHPTASEALREIVESTDALMHGWGDGKIKADRLAIVLADFDRRIAALEQRESSSLKARAVWRYVASDGTAMHEAVQALMCKGGVNPELLPIRGLLSITIDRIDRP